MRNNSAFPLIHNKNKIESYHVYIYIFVCNEVDSKIDEEREVGMCFKRCSSQGTLLTK